MGHIIHILRLVIRVMFPFKARLWLYTGFRVKDFSEIMLVVGLSFWELG